MQRESKTAASEHGGTEPDLVEIIADLMRQDLTVAEIGRRTGLSEWRVNRIACDHRLTRPADARKEQLSQRHARILTFIQDYTALNVYPPSLREIMEGCNLSSTSVALHNLMVLGQRGYLTRTRDVARSIVLTEKGRSWSPVPPETPVKEAA